MKRLFLLRGFLMAGGLYLPMALVSLEQVFSERDKPGSCSGQQEAPSIHEHDPEIMIANFVNILVHGAQAVNPSKPTGEKLDALTSVLMSIAAIVQLAFKDTSDDASRAALEKALRKAFLENPEFLVLLDQRSPAISRQLSQIN